MDPSKPETSAPVPSTEPARTEQSGSLWTRGLRALGFGKKEAAPATYTPPAPPTSEATVTSNRPGGPALPDAFSSSPIPDASATAAPASMPASLEDGSISTDSPVTPALETPTEVAPTPIGLPPEAPAAQPEEPQLAPPPVQIPPKAA